MYGVIFTNVRLRSCFTITFNHTMCASRPSCWGRRMNLYFVTVWAKWTVEDTFGHWFLTFTLRDIRLCRKRWKQCCYFNTLPTVVIDLTGQEVIRKAVAFIWNDSNAKGRSSTHLLVKYLHPELYFWQTMDLTRLFRSG